MLGGPRLRAILPDKSLTVEINKLSLDCSLVIFMQVSNRTGMMAK